MDILIIGAGFAGLAAAKALDKKLKTKQHNIILFDKNPYTTMIPALPDFAGEIVEESMLMGEINKLLPEKIKFKNEKVLSIDLDKKIVQTESYSYKYDYLILTAGSVTNFFDFDSDIEKIHTLTSLGEALKTYNDFIEYLNTSKTPVLIMSGTGYTGIELAFQLNQTALNHSKKIKVILLEKSNKILPFLNKKQHDHIMKYISNNGFELLTGTYIEKIEGESVFLSNGECIKNAFICWSSGTKISISNIKGEFTTMPDGRIIVNKNLQVPNYPNVFAAGDFAAIEKNGEILRKAANFSIYSGAHAGQNTERVIKNKALKEFKPYDLGWVLPLGQTSVGLILNKFDIYGLWGMRLHYLMCGYRNYSLTNKLNFFILAIILGVRKMKIKQKEFFKIMLKSGDYEKFGYFALRVIFGAGFIYHGISKFMMGIDNIATAFTNMGIPMANFFAPLVAFTELFSGILLVLGLFTRITSLAIMTIMFVAMTVAQAGMDYSIYVRQLTIVYFFIGLLYFFGGGGEFSADNLLYKTYKHKAKRRRIHI